ncbi:VHS subgroup [Niveomyces insectorum RCEF 264]|uniref:VHS subgroup n=1 Tax=Niveomyces insectorum RCEF 264 TaxID=1081102 RepID=A0A167SQP5_9HYPO|nr:VHS subgroup [Niveomyces insectorum RCEF 264]
MEATSARYAARDRWGEPAYPAPSQLQRFIQSACSPENYEPNLALNLEIADLINAKKGSMPREAATTIVGYVNHRNPNVALLALNLLDICVKNCGYPFHLQISTKEFLNELVRRFPERPPARPTRVQQKILAAIEEWRGTICETSRYKEDLGFIRDMHRLLSYKGYTFPEVRREDAAVLNPSDNLQSAEEMEEEEREAQSAKLQELIRRGTPEDLQEANRLMKVMAGYDTRSKVDYRAKAAEEVAKIQQKARLLEERLAAFQPGADSMRDGDVFDELAAALSSAQPKIQKMCEEESDDHAAVARLLEINDSIHRTVERYKLLKKGDVAGANKVAQGGPAPSATQELSLIDLDGDTANGEGGSVGGGGGGGGGSTETQPSNGASTAPRSTGIESDLLGLSFNEPSTSFGSLSSAGGSGNGNGGSGGGIALGFGANSNVPGPALLSSILQSSSAKGPVSTPLASTSPIPSASSSLAAAPTPTIAPTDATTTTTTATTSDSAFSSLFAPFSSAPSQSSTPQPHHQSPSSSSAFAPPKAAAPTSDPFAALASPKFRSSASVSPAPAASSPPTGAAAAPSSSTPETAGDDEEWSFSSALPPDPPAAALPTEHRAVAGHGPVTIELRAFRSAEAPAAIRFALAFSNNAAQPVAELHFQAAVTRGFELRLQPQSGRTLAPHTARGIQQTMEVSHAQDKSLKVTALKLRWRLAYRLGGQTRTDTGEVPEFELA